MDAVTPSSESPVSSARLAGLRTTFDQWVWLWRELGKMVPKNSRECFESVAEAHPDQWQILVPAGITSLSILRAVADRLDGFRYGFLPRWHEGHMDGEGWAEFTGASVRRRWEEAYGLLIAAHREATDDGNAIARAKGGLALSAHEGPPGILLVEYALMFCFARVFGGDFLDRESWTVCADGPGGARRWAAGFQNGALAVTHVPCDFRHGLYSSRQVAEGQAFGLYPDLR